MKHKKIVGLVVALGVLVGPGFGFSARATDQSPETSGDPAWSGERGHQQRRDFESEGCGGF